jgi:hypothetical protein
MEAITERCCGLDVHQATVVACRLTGRADERPRKQVRTFRTVTQELLELRASLQQEGCTRLRRACTGSRSVRSSRAPPSWSSARPGTSTPQGNQASRQRALDHRARRGGPDGHPDEAQLPPREVSSRPGPPRLPAHPDGHRRTSSASPSITCSAPAPTATISASPTSIAPTNVERPASSSNVWKTWTTMSSSLERPPDGVPSVEHHFHGRTRDLARSRAPVASPGAAEMPGGSVGPHPA